MEDVSRLPALAQMSSTESSGRPPAPNLHGPAGTSRHAVRILVAVARPTIVIVEDEEPIATAVAARLRSEGFDAVVAGDGPTGVELVERLLLDLVVLELMLPGMEGFEVCWCIQSHLTVPVIIFMYR